LQQTLLPALWIIVDDGSIDRTAEILSTYENKAPWMRVIRRERSGGRQLGTAEIVAFNAGYSALQNVEYEYIVKLDCDVLLPPNYFERLLERFNGSPQLGIASGVYLEDTAGTWHPIQMPAYHAAGASKVVRRECFEQIGGFVAVRGWDTVDEIKAVASNWRTCHFEDIYFYHLKPEGSGSGWRSTQVLHGEAYYRYGGSKFIFFLKVLQRSFVAKPIVLGAAAMTYGYLKLFFTGQPKLVTPAEACVYRKLQYSQFFRHKTGAFQGLSAPVDENN
jgi:glycosyltransferase involved in cell wall biosynthesis